MGTTSASVPGVPSSNQLLLAGPTVGHDDGAPYAVPLPWESVVGSRGEMSGRSPLGPTVAVSRSLLKLLALMSEKKGATRNHIGHGSPDPYGSQETPD